MPERKMFRGREVKNAKLVDIDGVKFIQITFASRFGQPGQQIQVSLEEYKSGLTRSFQSRSSCNHLITIG